MENLPTSQNLTQNSENTETAKLPTLSKKPHNLFIIASLLIVLVAIGVFVYLLKGTQYFITKSVPEKTQNPKTTSQKEGGSAEDVKVSFLKSKNLSTVTVGAALNFVPITEMKLDYGSPSYNFQFYGLELTEEQHKKFVSHTYPYGEFPNSVSIINDSPVWLASIAGGSDMLLTKRGFVCLTPIDYGPILCADDGPGSCIYPQFKGLECAFVKSPKENSFDKVSQFVQESLKDAGVNCGGLCVVKEMGENQVTIGEFSKEIIYFEGVNPQNAEKYINLVEQEAEESTSYFRNAGWNTNKKNITEIERGSNPGVFSSIQIISSNGKFNCQQTITISNRWGVEATGSTRKREIVECSIHPSMLGKVAY